MAADYFSVAELNYLISAPAPLSLSLFCLRLQLQNNFGFTGTVTLDYLSVFLQFLGHALRRDVGIKTIFALVSQLQLGIHNDSAICVQVPELNVQNGVLKSLSFLFEYIGEMGKDYIYAVTPLLEDALMDRYGRKIICSYNVLTFSDD